MKFKDCGCGCDGEKQRKKFMISFVSGVIFFIVANPETFMLVRKMLGKWVASESGCPTTLGLVLHSLVFLLVVWGIMSFKKEKLEGALTASDAKASAEASMMKMPSMPSTTPADKPMSLPPMEPMDQPMMDAPPYGSAPPPQKTGVISKIGSMLGGKDISGPTDSMAMAPLSGTSWRTCSCGDGSQVMIMK